MKRMKPIPLSNEGSYEAIVNAKTAQNRKQSHQRISKMLFALVILVVALSINLILWAANAIPAEPSIWISEIISCTVCFIGGRVWEASCK